MLDFTIREATPQDAKGIAHVHVKTWQCAYRGQIPDSYLDGLSVEQRMETWKKNLAEQNEKNHASVALHKQAVIGWCTYGVSRDDDVSNNTGELYGIYVHPDFIGKGVGSALMKRALKQLRDDGYAKATLWMLESNEKSQGFYEHQGWQKSEDTKDDVRDGFTLHEVRYVRQLDA